MSSIRIYLRDCNGKNEVKTFNNRGDAYGFVNETIEEYDDVNDVFEIQLVIVDGACVYSALANRQLNFFELRGFFA